MGVYNDKEKDKILDKFYYTQGYNNSRDSLYNLVRNEGISRRYVQAYLNRQKNYQISKPVNEEKKQDQNVIEPKKPFHHFQMDTINMSSLSHFNKGIHYLLTIIDIFTKKAFVYPLRNNSIPDVIRALGLFLREVDEKPKIINCDNGGEFKEETRAFLKKHDIVMINSSPHSPQSQAFVERFNGTLKRSIMKSIAKTNEKNYVDSLQKIVDQYNSNKQKSTKVKPNEANENAETVKENIDKVNLKRVNNREKDDLLEVNDKVRIVRKKLNLTTKERGELQFQKSFVPNWSDQIYIISHRVIPKNPLKLPYYHIESFGKKQFFRRDLLKVEEAENKEILNVKKLTSEELRHKKTGRELDILERVAVSPRKTRARTLIKKPKRFED